MIRFAIRTLLTAFVLVHIAPMIHGAHFTGSFWPDGVVYGLLLAVVAHVLKLLVSAFTVGTAFIGLIVLIPAAIFGFWLVPAIELRVLAHYFPQHLSFSGWGSAILVGLVLLVVNIVSASSVSKS
jgi:uncharacterized membrane protein YvlD (DUF360 family)